MSSLRFALLWILIAAGLAHGNTGSAETLDPDQEDASSSTKNPTVSYLLTPDIVEDEMGRRVDVERGLLFVPENRRAPNSRQIAVHFVRFPPKVTSPGPRAPVFLLAGGPGWGFDLSDPLTFDEIELLRRTREVIYVSQRGYPWAPGLVPVLQVQYAPRPFDEVSTDLERAERDRDQLVAAFDYWQDARGVDLAGYDILNIAEDLNDLRIALGYEKIVLRGCSFGSQWSLAYMKRWPKTVDRALLSGVEPLDYAYDSPQWLWDSLERLAKAAEATPRFASQLPEGGVLEALKTVIGRLEAAPVEVKVHSPTTGEEITVPVGADDLRGLLTRLRLNQRRRIQNLAQWPRFILELHRGDYRFLAVRVMEARSRPRSESLIGPLIDNSLGISSARDERLLAESAARWLGDINLDERITRDVTPTPKVDEAFLADWQIDVPTLLIGADYDWATPVENAEHLLQFLETGHLVTIQGGTHCSETNHSEVPHQLPEERARLYQFIDLDFSATAPRAFFSTLPERLALESLDFAPPTARSLYDEWRDTFD